ncbi:MAG: glycosyltransferase family 4 protein [Nitrospirae bacterium]|nr:glycosyltransferase family 4 protein [Nitrospirota bacterium]
MKRVLYVADAGSIHTRRWAEFFRDQGIEVHVASFRGATIAGVSVHVLPTYGLGRLGYLLAIMKLRALARCLRADVVHAQYVTSYGFLAAAARLRPLVLTAWGTDVLISPRKSRLMRWLARYAVRSADQITTVAQHMNRAVAELGIPEDEVVAVPFGVDTERFRPPTVPRPAVPPLRVISTRNFGPIYSVHTVIEAVRLLREQGIDACLDLVGDGPLRGALEKQTTAAGLRSHVVFHGHVDHARLAALLGQAHVCVSPALSDGNNVSLNEAMACGCFPIATNIPANAQWIVHGDNGYLYRGGHAAELAELLAQAMVAPDLRERASVKNLQIVASRADWRVCVREMQTIYNRLAQSAKSP